MSYVYRKMKNIIRVLKNMPSRVPKRSTVLLMCVVLRRSSVYQQVDMYALLLRHWAVLFPYLETSRHLVLPPVQLSRGLTSESYDEDILVIHSPTLEETLPWIDFSLSQFTDRFLIRQVVINVDSFALCED